MTQPSKRRRTAIFALSHAWTGPLRLGMHQLGREFSRQGWRCAAVSLPVSPMHLLAAASNPDIPQRIRQWRRGARWNAEGIFTCCPFTLLPYLSRWPFRRAFTLRTWQRFGSKAWLHRLRDEGFEQPDLLLVDSPLFAFLRQALQPARFVYRIGDYTPAFKASCPALLAAEREAARAADLVIYPAGELASYVLETGASRSLHLPNGVEAAHFSGARQLPSPSLFRSIPTPRILYVGAIGPWFDWQRLGEIARRMPDCAFVLVGPDSTPQDERAQASNIHSLGPVPYSDLPAYLGHAAAGILAFSEARYPKLVAGVNPLKIYEYLAAGLPVVSSPIAGFSEAGDLVAQCADADAFVAALRQALAEDSSELRTRRQEAARESDWSHRYRSLVAALGLEQPA